MSGKGKGKEERRDGWGWRRGKDGRLGESQAQTDEDKQCWWTGRFGVLQGGGKEEEDNQDSTEKERRLWREKPEPPGRGELALMGERHSRTGMRYALLLL